MRLYYSMGHLLFFVWSTGLSNNREISVSVQLASVQHLESQHFNNINHTCESNFFHTILQSKTEYDYILRPASINLYLPREYGFAWQTGLPNGGQISVSVQIAYNAWIAAQTHARGMGVAMKNNNEAAAFHVDDYDMVVNEECWINGNCPNYVRPCTFRPYCTYCEYISADFPT